MVRMQPNPSPDHESRMQHGFTRLTRSRSTLLTWLLVISLAGVASCATDVTAPGSHAEASVDRLLPASAGQRTYVSADGRVWTMDHATSTLSDGTGHRVTVSFSRRARIEAAFDAMNRADLRVGSIRADAGYAKHLASAVKLGYHPLLRRAPPMDGIMRESAPAPSPRTSMLSLGATSSSVRSSGPQPEDGWGFCDDVALSIRQLTPKYEADKRAYLDALDGYKEALLQPTPEPGPPPLETLLLDDAAATLLDDVTQLNVYAVWWNAADCWDQPSDNGGTWGGGSGGSPGFGDGGSGGGEWLVVEVSYDGGVTWSRLWEGYVV